MALSRNSWTGRNPPRRLPVLYPTQWETPFLHNPEVEFRKFFPRTQLILIVVRQTVLPQSSDAVAPKPIEDFAPGLNIGSNSDSRRPTDPESSRESLFKEPLTNKSDAIQQNPTSKRKVERLEAPVRKKAKVIDTTPLLTPARADASTISLDAVDEGLRLQERQVTKVYITPQKFPIQGSQLSATTRFKALVPKKDHRVMPVIGAQLHPVVDSSAAKTSVKHSKVQETADSLQTMYSPLDFST
jgi:hypothetical protein